MSLEEFKESLLVKYNKINKNGGGLDIPSDSDIIMLYLSLVVLTEFEMGNINKIKRGD